MKPSRAILTKEDLERFQTSPALERYMDFLTKLNDSVRNIPLSYKSENESSSVNEVVELLEIMSLWIDDIPPQDVGISRFGNASFRTWFDKASNEVGALLSKFVSEQHIEEVSAYLMASFGDRKRIDYGTGHEAHFICFLLCLYILGVLTENDLTDIVLTVFWKYIQLMRKLQFVYWLEPAGSHGVWGLDDYQFLPFLFGSSQLVDHKYLRPKSIHDKDVLEEMSKDYMYLSCIQHINSIKTASLRWHSPMLDDISGVKKWEKVNSGMFKMYRAEVLNKLPIMQHFLFGSFISFEGGATGLVMDPEQEHIHALGQEHPGCCSIRIPSAIAAASQTQTKPIPFD